MKVLLINPPNHGRSIPEEEYGITSIKAIFKGEPLALEVIAGNLYDHDVMILDLKVDPLSILMETVNRFQPDIVGITSVTCEADALIDIATTIKRELSGDAPIVVAGGHHASCDPDYFNIESIDYIVCGVGKASFRTLINAIEKQCPVSIPGVAKTDPSTRLDLTPRKYTFEDLVDHRPPRYDLVERYRDTYVMGGIGKAGFVVTAYGCVHACSFCSIPAITQGSYLTHSIAASIANMKTLDSVSLIRCVDANTFGNIPFANKFARAIIESKVNKKIVADVRADTVVNHPEVIDLWQQAGLVAVVIGFEEIDDRRLAFFNKKSSVQTNIKALDHLKKTGLKVIGDFIISPDYDRRDFKALETFIDTHDIELPVPSILTPIPGTPLYRHMKDKIEITDLSYYTFSNAVTETTLGKAEFYTLYADLFKKFHSHISKS
ncbi:MAG: cobalamin-dependent protein [Desulfobacterium sp.]|nr:cobalamin-dependent protein [Desulfobacterium sp.]